MYGHHNVTYVPIQSPQGLIPIGIPPVAPVRFPSAPSAFIVPTVIPQVSSARYVV